MTCLERAAVLFAVFLGGALLMAAEVAAFRVIGKSFGTALRETTAVIAVFLTAMSIGYWAGGRAGDRWPRPSTLVAALATAAATLTAVPWLDAAVAPRLAASSLPLAMHAFVLTSVLFALPTAFFSSISPIAIRLFATTAKESGTTAGSISALSTAGSIAGSIVTAFFLLDWLVSISRTLLFVALAALVAAATILAAGARRMGRERLRPLLVAVAIMLVLGFAATVFVRSTRLEASLLTPVPGTRVLFTGDSPYHRITVREHARTRELVFNLNIQSLMTIGDPYSPGAAYTDAGHLAPLLRERTRRVLLIGLGGGTLPKQFRRDYGDTTIDVVEVDPLVAQVARRYFAVTPDARLRIHVADGRTFLQRSSETWDLIHIDAYTTNRYGDTIPPHLATREFFAIASRHLAPGGVLHFHCAYDDKPIVPALEKTMASVFGSVIVARGEILGSNVPLIVDREAMLAKVERSPVRTLPHLREYVAEVREIAKPAASTPLLTDDYAPVDALLGRR